MTPLQSDPAQLSLRMPAEWEPHKATWIAWPHRHDDWPGKFAAIPWVYTEIVRHLRHSEQVCILVNDDRAAQRVQGLLRRAGINLDAGDFFDFATNRVWTRDYGPIFVVDAAGNLGVTDWHFNGWAKYTNWQRDDAIPRQVSVIRKLPYWEPTVAGRRVVLEGGSIDVNGRGLLLTTEECLLSPVQERNPGLTRADYERLFADYLGVHKVLWLGRGIAGAGAGV